MTDKQIIISDYFTATLILPEKIVEYQLKPCKDDQLVDKINEQNSYLKRKEQECERLNKHSVGFARKCQNLELDVCHLKDKNYNLQRQLDQLKVENEGLKEKIMYLESEIDRLNG